MEQEQAKSAALRLGRKRCTLPRDDDELVVESTTSGLIGWVFALQSRHHVETDNFDSMVAGRRHVFVSNNAERVVLINGSIPTNAEVWGRPGHDWPPRAWLTMPTAVLAQAIVWFACWNIHIAFGGLVWINFVTVSLAGLIATAPTWKLVRISGFRNIHKAIPIGALALGIIIGEAAFLVQLIQESSPGIATFAALSGAPELLAAQSADYLVLQALAVVVMIGVSSRFDADKGAGTQLWDGLIFDPSP